ncbi:MAG: TonB-dependent receptor, partial [Gammaproteobacteria bacterium]|nr:TonB-dependent receptor [Gammaproteobacteria bacterium]
KSHVMGVWTHRQSPASEHEVRFSYDRLDDDTSFPLAREFNTYDFGYQHTWSWSAAQTLVWGLGYRHVDYDTDGSLSQSINPAEGADDNWNFFVHNESSLFDDRVDLSYGLRFEDNERGGSAVQPNVRVSWRVDEHKVLWASLARAIRTPSIAENSINTTGLSVPPGVVPPLPVPVIGAVQGLGSLDSEWLDGLDVGFRWHLTDSLSLDVAAFAYDYDDIILVEFEDVRCLDGTSIFSDPTCVLTSPLLTALNTTQNAGDANSYGAELSVSWAPLPNLSFEFNHSYLDLDIDGTDTAAEFFANQISGPNPEHQSAFTWRYRPLPRWTVDGQVRRVSKLRNPEIDGYTVFDLRIGWEPRPGLRVALVGQDLGDSRHLEFVDNFGNGLPAEVEDTFLLQLDLSL